MTNDACILAGGKSSRMGEDKGLKLLHGKQMIRYVIESLIPRFPTIKISTNNLEYNVFGYELLADIIPEKGPMGGIYTALKNSLCNDVFITGCDMPFISGSSLDYMLQRENKSATVAVCNGKIQPLFGIYSKNLIPLLESKIEQNQLSMMKFLQEINTALVEINNEDEFLNMNTPGDIPPPLNPLKGTLSQNNEQFHCPDSPFRGWGGRLQIFGKLTDIFGADNYTIEPAATVSELKEKLEQAFPQLVNCVYLVVVNDEIAPENSSIPSDAEVALLPPYSGG